MIDGAAHFVGIDPMVKQWADVSRWIVTRDADVSISLTGGIWTALVGGGAGWGGAG